MNIPYPDNPLHTDNLASISLLEAQGWQGSDTSLRECIFFHGFAWRTLPEPNGDGDDTLFIYEVTGRRPRRFDRSAWHSSLNFKQEYNWMAEEDWDDFLGALGTDWDNWCARSFPSKLEDLVRYYGRLNIMGDTYWDGFEIEDS